MQMKWCCLELLLIFEFAAGLSTVIVTFVDNLPIDVGNGTDASGAAPDVAPSDIPGVRLVMDLPYLGEAIYQGLSDSQDADDICDAVMMHRNIETCEPDSTGGIDQGTANPNDPVYPEQTYLNTTNVVSVWQQNIFGNKNVRIGIIDSGVDLYNPDIAASLWTNPSADNSGQVHCASFLNGIASGNCTDANG